MGIGLGLGAATSYPILKNRRERARLPFTVALKLGSGVFARLLGGRAQGYREDQRENLLHTHHPTPPPSTVQPFWLLPIHFSKPALQSFVPPKARKLPRRGWLDSLFSIEIGGLFPFHSLTPALSPMGFTHAARMGEGIGQWWGYQPVLANIR